MTRRSTRFASLLTLAAALLLALQPAAGLGETLRFVWAADSRVDKPPSDPTLIELMNKPVLDAIGKGVLALSPRPSFMVFGGDMAYRGKYKGQWTFDTWLGVMKPLTDAGIPIYTTLGNHELYQHPATAWSFNLENQQQFQQTFTTNPGNGPTGYERLAYSFTSPGGDAFFAVLDPYFLTDNANPANLTGHIDDAQLAWLESQLAQTTATHKFLFIHTPYYYVSTPPPVPDESYTRLWKILDAHRFAVYFCGHSHLYSRRTIDRSVLPNPPWPGIDTWKNNVVQLLNGAAGAGPDTAAVSVDRDLWHVANAPKTYYFTVVDIDGDRVRLTSYMGDTGDYVVFDVYPDVTGVPALSTWAIAACGSLLLLSALLALRRRRAAPNRGWK
jgi:3',5'-cyclic AMP phosphodiesterase CpdA